MPVRADNLCMLTIDYACACWQTLFFLKVNASAHYYMYIGTDLGVFFGERSVRPLFLDACRLPMYVTLSVSV